MHSNSSNKLKLKRTSEDLTTSAEGYKERNVSLQKINENLFKIKDDLKEEVQRIKIESLEKYHKFLTRYFKIFRLRYFEVSEFVILRLPSSLIIGMQTSEISKFSTYFVVRYFLFSKYNVMVLLSIIHSLAAIVVGFVRSTDTIFIAFRHVRNRNISGCQFNIIHHGYPSSLLAIKS